MATKEEMLKGLEDSFKSFDETTPYCKFLVYGPSGTGKTVLALELAQVVTDPSKEILYIDACEGWASITNHPELKTRVRRSIFQGLSQLEILCMAIEAKAGSFKNVGCIILDEFSTMARQDVDIVLTARAAGDDKKDPDVATFTDTGVSTRRMDRGTAKLLKVTNYGVHLIFVAHERKDKDNLNKEVISPAFMPAFKAIIKSDMHVVGRLTATVKVDDKGDPVYDRKLQVHPTVTVEAKSRVGGLSVHCSPVKFVDTYKKWLNGTGSTESIDRLPASEKIEVEAADDEFAGIRVE